MRHNLSTRGTVAETTRSMPWYVIFVFVEPPLPQRRPSFSASLSCDVSIFPSFLLRLPLLCVIAGHVTPSHLRTVVASPSHVIIQIVQFHLVNSKSHAAFFHVFFCRLFLITASFSYSMRVQMEIIYRKH